MQCPRITDAKVISRHMLAVYFSNQETKLYDIRQILDKEMFAPLQNPTFFKNFKIESGGYALVWNEEIDISEYELWKNGVPMKEEGNIYELFESYAKNADDTVLDSIQARVPDVPPIAGDELLE